ncbi:MAG: TonB-dependent receptor, partial [Candidatus Cloacimonadaceae bacterium]|nr:TonB-dependent receptor [Candidatus Cloacimonadaceae bacterium]
IQWRQYYLNGVSWKPFNVGKADIQNYEIESLIQLGKLLTLNGSITFTEATDISKNQDGTPSPTYQKKLVYTPDLKAVVGLAMADDKRGISIRYSHTGKQYSTADNLIAPLPAFDNLDAALFYRISLAIIDMQIDLKVNNIMNKRYNIYAYIPQPGINWTARISLSAKNSTRQSHTH